MTARTVDWFRELGDGERAGFESEAAAVVSRCESGSFVPFGEDAVKAGARKIYLDTLDLPDKKIDALIDYVLGSDAKLLVRLASTLTEVGLTDSRFGRSPVMLLHEFGLLERSEIVSGVYLDKDDLALMAQCGVPLTVLPTTDAGYGRGVAPAVAALERGVRLKVGSGDGKYNRSRSALAEARTLGLLTSAVMNRENAIRAEELAKTCLRSNASEKEIELAARALYEI